MLLSREAKPDAECDTSRKSRSRRVEVYRLAQVPVVDLQTGIHVVPLYSLPSTHSVLNLRKAKGPSVIPCAERIGPSVAVPRLLPSARR